MSMVYVRVCVPGELRGGEYMWVLSTTVAFGCRSCLKHIGLLAVFA